MKKISVLIPCYNEVENAGPISKAVTDILEKELPQYDYELVFIDNDSTDGTAQLADEYQTYELQPAHLVTLTPSTKCMIPDSSLTSTSTVGLPLESSISRPVIDLIFIFLSF